mmetsp:Transcript_39190/g.81341  ORF Transcript_39190/g.81341 Transcript_39190/m.81341 type:complete len:230 (+) Transcript_39190:384-1073(+)
MISKLGKLFDKYTAKSFNKPLLSKTPMLIKIPRKNKMPAVSSLARAAGTLSPSFSSAKCMTSVNVHMKPNPVNMAKYGGRPVNSANTGTANKQAIPDQNTNVARGDTSVASGNAMAEPSSSSTWLTKNASDPTKQTKLGRKSSVTVGIVDNWLLIQSIVVVTSPMGVHTPPALAATTTMAPNKRRSLSSGTSFRSKDTITIVTVRLFRIADKKNVKNPIVQNNDFFDVV